MVVLVLRGELISQFEFVAGPLVVAEKAVGLLEYALRLLWLEQGRPGRGLHAILWQLVLLVVKLPSVIQLLI